MPCAGSFVKIKVEHPVNLISVKGNCKIKKDVFNQFSEKRRQKLAIEFKGS